MLARRRFATCVVCAAGGLLASAVGVRAQAPGFTRTVLNRSETPGDTMVTVQILVEIDPDFLVARHTHPGTETGYFLEGGGILGVKDQPDRPMKAGDAFQIPVEVPHFVQNGPTKTRVLSTYVVDKSKPLASPAPL
jgi:quercetin dioxygenase-like cupin family protein